MPPLPQSANEAQPKTSVYRCQSVDRHVCRYVGLTPSVQNADRDLIRQGLVRSAHDCSEGGLAVNLAESCLGGNLGAKTEIPGPRADIALFNESQSRIVITITPENAAKAEDFLKSKNISHSRLGTVVADQTLTIQTTGKPYAWPLEKLRTPFEKTIPSLMSSEK